MEDQTTRVHFANAPVVEMMQAVFFAPITNWDLLDFGLLWQKLSPRYASHKFQLPIAEVPQFQNQVLASIQQQNIGKFPVRCWFIDQSEHELVQVQDSCLIHNWRKLDVPEPYPGYEGIRANFINDWRVFTSFLTERSHTLPPIWKAELTYVDQFVRGHEWNTFADLPKIYRLWRGMEAQGPLSVVEFASFTVNYAVPQGSTRLVFASQPAVRTDGKEIIQLTVTATGKPESSREPDILRWFNSAHDSIIEGFINFTTPEIQEYWRRTR